MHTLLDRGGPVPAFIEVSDGKRHDVHLFDDIEFEPDAFFVTRTKTGVILKRRYSRPVPLGTGVGSDQTVRNRSLRKTAVSFHYYAAIKVRRAGRTLLQVDHGILWP